ncbi:ABC transporter ATP-binding protein [Halocynthiibacter namhaensis]|uniref:ABC transporter ATP-binding protein n=1 Tax=Halocynthiibacter namhaensis TaxID=1290553 RepID=UPI0005791E63|nr:ABC transporter ATP-binding protein [Halocynthiibacter namhaensis]
MTKTASPNTTTPTNPEIEYTSRTLFARLWTDYLRHHKLPLAVVAILMIINGGSLAVLAKMLEPMFDNVFVGGDAGATWWIGGVILGLFVVRGIAELISKTMLASISMRSSTDMQVDLLRHILSLDSQFFHKNPPGSLMERIQGDTVQVQSVWRVVIQGIGRDFFSLFGLFFVAIITDPVWTFFAVIAVPLLILPTAALQRYIRRKTKHLREEAGKRSTRLDEIFHGIHAIKLNQMETYQVSQFRSIIDRIVKAEVKTAAGQATTPTMIDFITGLGFFAVLIVGGQEIISGEKSVGQFMTFFTAMSLTFQPLRRLGAAAGTWQIAAASLERLYRLFDTKPTITSPSAPTALRADAGTEVKFNDVKLDYGNIPALRGLNCVAEAGKTTAFVGTSGAGKSTVFNVLTRMTDPTSGHVTLGGTDISQLSLDDLRAQFSSVAQDALLFDETLRENVMPGIANVDNTHLQKALEAANVADFVNSLPDGLDSPAGPRGANLSGGQRQRIAIARALLRDARVLLLDEATSALDTKSEAVVQAAIEALSEGRTTLVIAHRLSTIRNADKIIVLDQGRVAEEGSHDDLLAKDGIYAGLWALQSKSPAT